MLKDDLLQLWNNFGDERCGVILASGKIKELPNIHPDPTNYFAMDAKELKKKNIIASWHTHPTTGPNLSVADYKGFLLFPHLDHYIVAENQCWKYKVDTENETIILEDF